ncbi:MAG TPA: hypothetical protein VEC99_18225 [Clostridia bacterium]|nr:hypothetical protein [Clostridia bacterium]
MNANIGRVLFPKAAPWERRRKVTALFFGVVGGVFLVSSVAFLMLAISGKSLSARGINAHSGGLTELLQAGK